MKNLYKIENELYIVSSSEKIKENTQTHIQGFNGDWFYNTIYNFIARTGDITSYDFKIILTTNKLLIDDGVQSIDDEFLEWFVKNPSCERVEVYKDKRLEFEQDFHFYEITIPKEEPKHPKVFSENGNELFFDEQGNMIKEEPKQEDEYIGECKGNDGNGCFMDSCGHNCGCFKKKPKQEETLEEFTKESFKSRLEEHLSVDYNDGVKLGAKWQQERSYSEEDMRRAFCRGFGANIKTSINDAFYEWFEQFKK